MASSVFTDSPISSSDYIDGSGGCGESQSQNLVVVYGKNGLNVDRNGLECLVDDRNISSVSVVRLSSPTPSMKDEEEKNGEISQNSINDAADLISSLEFSPKPSNCDDDEPELVGLTVEEFYPPEEAKKLAKEILNYAGVANPLQIKIDYEYQRMVIQNDHCYTPLTSPSQGKPKKIDISDYPETSPSTSASVSTVRVQHGKSVRRVLDLHASPQQQQQQQASSSSSQQAQTATVTNDQDEKEKESEEDEEDLGSEYTESSFSESDNDRDSDLDFNVNDRGRRTRKTSNRKKKPLAKIVRKRQSSNAERDHATATTPNKSLEEERKVAPIQKTNRQSLDSRKPNTILQNVTAVKTVFQPPPKLVAMTKPAPIQKQPPVLVQKQPPVLVQKQPPVLVQKQPPVLVQKQATPAPVQKQPSLALIPKQTPSTSVQKQPPAPISKPQPVPIVVEPQKSESRFDTTNLQRIQISKMPEITSITPPPGKIQIQQVIVLKKDPTSEGVFQDINTLLSASDGFKKFMKIPEQRPPTSLPSNPIMIRATPPVVQQPVPQQPEVLPIQQPAPIKGFMPLVPDSAIKSQLPTQISIQTHVNPSELAAEHDKQLDLIDSIVKDEMNNSNVICKDPMNENIPQIVKMLENTEKAVLDKAKALSSATSSFTSPVEDIDIANAPLLDSAEDELTADLLQHVAELMENKNLQEVIDNQVLSNEIQPVTIVSSLDPTPSTIVQAQPVISQMPILTPQIAEKSVPSAVKKEPIQIVRGDGRVITLPPIEAPTTRAKRRLQSQNVSQASVIGSPATPPVATKTVTELKSESASSSRRSSVETQKSATRAKRSSTSVQNTPKEDFEGSGEDTADSEDDPNKLWCICRQPHNNRFMICCDKCEDWFHGTCVNITKAMGLEMEQRGVEWTCPKCMRALDGPTKKSVQKKISEIFDKKQPSLEEAKKSVEIIKKVLPSNILSKKVEQKKSTESAGKKTNDLQQRKISEYQKRISQDTPKSSKSLGEPSTPTTPGPPGPQKLKLVIRPANAAPSAQPQTPKEDSAMLSCIVCKKSARPNSIYCSDDCIRRHAQNALVTATKAKAAAAAATTPTTPSTPGEEKKKKISSFEEALAKAADPSLVVKHKVERVYVYERKTNRILTGNSAPTTANLKKWLQDNPTFEVVQPGSPQAMIIERTKQKVPRGNSESMPDTPTRKQPEQHQRIIKTSATTNSMLTSTPKQVKTIQLPTMKSANFYTVGEKIHSNEMKSTSDGQKSVSSAETKPENQRSQARPPKKAPTEQKSSQSNAASKDSNTSHSSREAEPIRLNVKRTLKEQIISRMNELKEADSLKLTLDEIDTFATETEIEMFKLFNKDTGAKYKAKYRSLMFNIRDRKNQTLFQKICQRQIEPKQLVRMSPEELASQELAQWRQNENKHQLEMIKKSELDLLSCAKNYVLKTHKGEEVIESKTTDRVSLDITIPVEDVVAVLNNSTVSSTSEGTPQSPTKSPSISSTNRELQKTNSFDLGDVDSSSAMKSPLLTPSTTSSSSNNHDRKKSKSKDRDRHHRSSKEKHKSRKRSRSRSRDRDRSGRDRDRGRHRSPVREDRKTDRDGDRDMHKKEGKHGEAKEKVAVAPEKTKKESRPPKLQRTESSAKPEDYNLIDKILESVKTVEEAANMAPEKEKIAVKQTSSLSSVASSTTTATSSTGSTSNKDNISGAVSDSDQEPSSTVMIATPPEDQYKRYSSDLGSVLWSGSINMIDVATFQIIVQPVSGVYTDLEKELPLELDVVGRISPDTVWDYIGKIKKSPNKEIVIIRVIPSCDTENNAYSSLYTYLDKRKRLGVVKSISPSIKDFYVLPLGNMKSLPSVLCPNENVEFFEDETRPDLLLGIIIRIMGKRPAPPATGGHAKVMRKTIEQTVISNQAAPVLEEQRFTPPSSPKGFASKKSDGKGTSSTGRLLTNTADDSEDTHAINASIVKDSSSPYDPEDDANDPYSPGGDEEDLSTIPTSMKPSGVIDTMSDELKRKMDEINRQIEAQKMEIAGMLNMDPPTSGSTFSPPALANISIPSNLQQILASIKNTEPPPAPVPAPASVPTPVPPPTLTAMIPPPPLIGPLHLRDISPEIEEYVPVPPPPKLIEYQVGGECSPGSSTGSVSRLAQLTEAELLSMVPDDVDMNKTKNHSDNNNSGSKHSIGSAAATSEIPSKKGRWDKKEPPPPGLEDEFL